MDELREKIVREIRLYGKNRGLFANITPEQIADRILSIPEIAEALACKAAFENVKTQRTIINYIEGKLGPSISTNKRTPV